MTPFISVVVPTFDRPQALSQCLAALSTQDYPRDRYEVIVVDDGSRHARARDVQQATEASGVRLLRQANQGPASARNHGARAARGAYVAFTDDDCTPAPTWLSCLAAASVAMPATALGGRTVNAVEGNPCADATQLLIDYLYGYYAGTQGAFFTSNNLLMPRREFLAIGGFDDTLRLAGAEDREICGRWLHHGFRLVSVADAVVYHRHALTVRGFWRQHFTYGQGAWHYRTSRARWTSDRVRLEPMAFYRDLLTYPLSRQRGFKAVALLALSQVANGTGFFCAAARAWAPGSRRHRGRSALAATPDTRRRRTRPPRR